MFLQSLNRLRETIGQEDIHFNISIDDKLINEARLIGKHKTKKEAVTVALEEYIQRLKQRRIQEAFGTIDFDPAYDYKAWRGKRSGF